MGDGRLANCIPAVADKADAVEHIFRHRGAIRSRESDKCERWRPNGEWGLVPCLIRMQAYVKGREVSAFAVVRAVPEGKSVELLHSTCRSSPRGHPAKINLIIWCLVQRTEA